MVRKLVCACSKFVVGEPGHAKADRCPSSGRLSSREIFLAREICIPDLFLAYWPASLLLSSCELLMLYVSVVFLAAEAAFRGNETVPAR